MTMGKNKATQLPTLTEYDIPEYRKVQGVEVEVKMNVRTSGGLAG